MRNCAFTAVFAVLAAIFIQSSAASAATLTVNDNLAGVVCNQTLSLSEAAQFAEDGVSLRNLTDGEKAQISGVTWLALPPDPNCGGAIWRAAVNGGVGKFVTDFIVFTNAVSQINDGILLGRDDRINGLKPNGSKVILDGTGLGNFDAITFMSFDDQVQNTTSSQVSNLVIRNFQRSGISAGYARGSVFEGLEIYGNGRHGIALLGNAEANPRTIRIGGAQLAQRNLIYGNSLDGISIVASSTGDRAILQNIQILNNYIGTSNGTADAGNNGNGIYLENTFGVVIGDPTGATRNVVSGNNNDGIKIVGQQSYSNEVIGNFIGTDSSGGTALGNSASGIAVLAAAGSAVDFVSKTPNLIGKPGLGNVISANNFGVFIADANTSNTWVEGNLIGTNPGGNSDLGNIADGVLVGAGARDNRIGGTNSGAGNLIAFNRAGIRTDSGIRNRFQRNRVFSNDQLGIDIGSTGVTQNDQGDADTGPNDLQNFPVITYVFATNSTVSIAGTLNSIANKPFTLEFFGNTAADPTGYGEGRNYLGQAVVNTNGSGNAAFDVSFSASLANATGQFVSATATDENGNTSEFSLVRNICADTVLSPAGFLAPGTGAATSFTVVRSTGCSATPVSNAPWIVVNSFLGGTVNLTVLPNSGPQRNSSISVSFNNGQFITFANFNVSQLAGTVKAPFDFDGDGKTDVSIFRPGPGQWWHLRSSDGGNGAATFGESTDVIVPADYTGDGKTDIAFFRPSIREWYVLRSNDFTYYSFPFGEGTDVPVPGDYDGDGKADTAVYRPSTREWYILRSSDNEVTTTQFGAAGDKPVPADYDGDGKTDIGIYRPSAGQWWLNRSTDGVLAVTFGNATDQTVPGDYTGDGKADIAYFRPSTNEWFVMRTSDLSFYSFVYGAAGDVPSPGDYDGDGKIDATVFRPSTNIWYSFRATTSATVVTPFGAAGDRSVPNAYVR